MNRNLRCFIVAAIFTMSAVYGLLSLMQWMVDNPAPKENMVYYRISDDKQLTRVIGVIAMEDTNGSIIWVKKEDLERNYYQIP